MKAIGKDLKNPNLKYWHTGINSRIYLQDESKDCWTILTTTFEEFENFTNTLPDSQKVAKKYFTKVLDELKQELEILAKAKRDEEKRLAAIERKRMEREAFLIHGPRRTNRNVNGTFTGFFSENNEDSEDEDDYELEDEGIPAKIRKEDDEGNDSNDDLTTPGVNGEGGENENNSTSSGEKRSSRYQKKVVSQSQSNVYRSRLRTIN